jgi:hypothetical protein
MGVLASHDHSPDEGQPYEEEARELLRNVDPGIEKVAQDDIAEDHDDHGRQQKNQQAFQAFEEEGNYPAHNLSLPLHPSRRQLILFAPEDSSSPLKAKHGARSKAQVHNVSIQRMERFRRQTAMHDSGDGPSVVSFSCFFAWNRINADFKVSVIGLIQANQSTF